MSADLGLDPLVALRRFVERVSPYDHDPAAGSPVTLWTGAGSVTLTPHLARALIEALERYRDPADRGTCARCGGRRLDDHLHCLDCGRLHGVFGELVAERARRTEWTGREAEPGTWTSAGPGTPVG